MELGLAGRAVFVVGGSGYIGAEVARQFSAEGAAVAIGGRDAGRLEEAADRIGADDGGDRVTTIVIDTVSDDSVNRAIDRFIERFGRIDVLVNTAAPSARTLDPAQSGLPDRVLEAVEGKPLGYLRVTNAVLPHMIESGFGRVVMIAGQNTYITGNIAGSVRNTAVGVIAKNLADSTAGTGVTVNTINPGIVTDDPSGEVQRGGFGDSTPADTAAAVLFLSSSLAGRISGESLAIGHRLHGAISL